MHFANRLRGDRPPELAWGKNVSAPPEYPLEHELPFSNEQIATCLEELADLLEAQGANLFRVRAYRTAAENLRNLQRPVHEILGIEGVAGLIELPGIGQSLAGSVEKLCLTGRLPLLERLRGEFGPEHLFMTLPGIGLEFASRIHEQLGVESLADLEVAAYDGRLAKVPGMGRKRVQGIQETLRGRFRRPLEPPPRPARARPIVGDPPVNEILDVDREYREKAAKGEMRLIAPRRCNPTGEAWLPVLHTHRDLRHYTALYSNTARAHERGMTRDWVVVYRDDRDGHGQWTVITSQFGPMRGKRIIRGRESECAAFYAHQSKRSVASTAVLAEGAAAAFPPRDVGSGPRPSESDVKPADHLGDAAEPY
jgi:putative hydrolase